MGGGEGAKRAILIIRNIYLNSYGILELFALTLEVNVDVYLKL